MPRQAGIWLIFYGLFFEQNAEIGQKGPFPDGHKLIIMLRYYLPGTNKRYPLLSSCT